MRKRIYNVILIFILISSCINAYTNSGEWTITENPLLNGFPVIYQNKATPILIDTADAEVVKISTFAFCNDIKLVSGLSPQIFKNKNNNNEYQIIFGTLGKSKLIDQLLNMNKIRVDSIMGKWEAFQISIVEKPFKGCSKALVVVGSDRRGTAYGIFELSRKIGVSPLVWWADVLPKHRNAVFVNISKAIVSQPSVKYRGIFLNDEDWGLKPWAAKNMDTTIRDIGPNSYSRIFELLLRLKANYIWPAMHDCTKAFYFYKQNPVIADKYAIVVGSSHCEPILRNNVFEWKENFKIEYGITHGEWRYDTNKTQIYNYWKDRAEQSKNFESVYTVGMRGIHDSGIPGPKDPDEKLKLLDSVITDQRQLLSSVLQKPASSIPQIFCPYKEVLSIYQRGLSLPQDVTIVWADDNYGYVRQLSSPVEQKRSGGSGVYYHLSYWGAPHDYLWLSSISPAMISYELSKAYAYNAKNLWVINVGDIKPAEMELQFTMDLAWDINSFTPQNAYKYTYNWAAQTFGDEYAKDISHIKEIYYQLAQNGKPEHLGKLKFSEPEFQKRVDKYSEIVAIAENQYKIMPHYLRDAYFQLVLYPVTSAMYMNKKIFYAQKSLELASHKDTTAFKYAKMAEDAFGKIQTLTQHYNKDIANGKWDGIMSWNPRNLEVFKMPEVGSDSMFSQNYTLKRFSFEPDKKNIIIPAAAYSSYFNSKGNFITKFNQLGIDSVSVGILPLTAPVVADSMISACSWLIYSLKLDTGNYILKVKVLPTHAPHKGRSVKCAISVNDSPVKFLNFNATAESSIWKVNVLRGYAVNELNFTINRTGKTEIKLYIPEPGTIVSQLEIEKNK